MYFFSTNTRKKGQHLRGVPSSTSSSASLDPSSCLAADLLPPSVVTSSLWAAVPPRVLRVWKRSLRRWALLDSLLRRESLGGEGLTPREGVEDDMLARSLAEARKPHTAIEEGVVWY